MSADLLIQIAVVVVTGVSSAVIAAQVAVAKLTVHLDYQRRELGQVRQKAEAAHYRLDLIKAPPAWAPDAVAPSD